MPFKNRAHSGTLRGDEQAQETGSGRQRSSRDNRISYSRLLAFFLPLAATPWIAYSTHNIINAALVEGIREDRPWQQ